LIGGINGCVNHGAADKGVLFSASSRTHRYNSRQGSLFLTRPGLPAHATDVEEYRKRVLDVFDAVERGLIRPTIWKTYALSDAAQAHEALESGKSDGAIVLKP
jgi:NADPH:quinone reductase-like Zn-dependent oxidoreductase